MQTIHRLARVNKKKIGYSNPKTVTMETDSDGLMTGEKLVTYDTKQYYYAYVTPQRGRADLDVFGVELNYDGVIIAEMDCPFDEETRLWIDTTKQAYNWVVVRKAKALQHIIYAIKEVDTSWSQLTHKSR